MDTCFTDPSLCPVVQRKFVKVNASADVPFVFLTIIGWDSVTIFADAVSEAASLDIVMIIDRSESMAFDASCTDSDDDDGDGVDDDCGATQNGATADDHYRDPNECNVDSLGLDGGDGTPGECHPFEEVKVAAKTFVQSLYYPFDRVSLVTYDLQHGIQFPLQSQPDANNIVAAINALTVAPAPQPTVWPCTWSAPGDDPSGCTSTSIGGGLLRAAQALTNPVGGPNAVRDEAVWVAILLSDGAANASDTDPLNPANLNVHCPNSTWWPQPFCRDPSAATRHSLINAPKFNPDNNYDPNDYDADDFARDMADLVGCPADDPWPGPDALWCRDSIEFAAGDGGLNALIFSIGLGDAVLNNPFGDPRAGEKMLRYAAAAGDDGDPETDLCAQLGTPPGQDCGNYFFAPSGNDLVRIFEEIASRIFTRITQ